MEIRQEGETKMPGLNSMALSGRKTSPCVPFIFLIFYLLSITYIDNIKDYGYFSGQLEAAAINRLAKSGQ
jgi:hypothetical protein